MRSRSAKIEIGESVLWLTQEETQRLLDEANLAQQGHRSSVIDELFDGGDSELPHLIDRLTTFMTQTKTKVNWLKEGF